MDVNSYLDTDIYFDLVRSIAEYNEIINKELAEGHLTASEWAEKSMLATQVELEKYLVDPNIPNHEKQNINLILNEI
jgi:hypothetical protein